MANLLSWLITHGLAFGVGTIIGAGSLVGAQLAIRKATGGRVFGPVAKPDPDPKARAEIKAVR